MPPYTKYKDTGIEWVGEIPEHWDTAPAFTALREQEIKNIGLQENNVLSLSYGKIISRDIEDNYGLLPASFETYQIINSGNIILRLTDLQNDKRSLRVGHVKERGIITSAYVCLKLNQLMISDYAYLLLHSYDVHKVFYAMGGGVRQTMTYVDLKRLPVIIPPLKEQQSIASYLDRKTQQIDILIEKKQKMIELLKEYRTAVINRAVTKGLNPRVKMQESGIEWLGEIPEHWDVKPLKHFANIVLGKMLTPEDKGGYVLKPYLRAQNITWGKVDDTDIKEMWFSEQELKQYRVRENDLLISEGGEVGRTAIWGNEIAECYIQNSVHKVTVSKSDSPRYFLYHSEIYGKTGYYDSQVNRVSIAHLTREKLKDIRFVYPPPEEQSKIADYLDLKTGQIDKQIENGKESIEKLEEYRTALISNTVTGKIDVRGNLS